MTNIYVNFSEVSTVHSVQFIIQRNKRTMFCIWWSG